MRAKRITVLAVTFIFLLTASASFARDSYVIALS
jgi:hypothetical protein